MDGGGLTGTTTRGVTVSNANNPPSLSWTGESGYTVDGVNPDSGDYTTTFVFRVKYTDPDGTSPSYVRVHIDGDAGHAMTYASGSITSGAIYSYSTTLGPNTHTYHFEASDGTASTRLPTTGELSGPTRTPPTNLVLYDAEWRFISQTPDNIPWQDWISSAFAYSDSFWGDVGVDAQLNAMYGWSFDIASHTSCSTRPTAVDDYAAWLSTPGKLVAGVNAYQLVTGLDIRDPDKNCLGLAYREEGELNSEHAASVIEGRDVDLFDSYSPGDQHHRGVVGIHEFGHLHGIKHYLDCRATIFGVIPIDCNLMHANAPPGHTGTWWTQGSKDQIRVFAWPKLH